MSFDPIQRFEPLTIEQLAVVRRCFTPTEAMVAGLNFIDVRYGVGVIDNQTKCMWTRSKRRVTIGYNGGGRIATISKVEDPNCPCL